MVPSASLVTYVGVLKDALGLKDWRIDLSDEPADDGNLASIYCWPGQRRATLHLGVDFDDEAPDEKRHTLVHELLHPHLHEMQACVDRSLQLVGSQAAHVLTAEHRNFLEHGVDAIAAAIAPLLPEVPDGTADSCTAR